MPPRDAEMIALRTAAAVTRLMHVRALRFGGPGALDVLDALTSSRLFIRENQMLHTLMLDASARPLADVFLCQDEDSLIVLAEGPSTQQLLAHVAEVRGERMPGAAVDIEDLELSNELWSIDGPFAWEVAAALLGPEVLGAPYLSFLHLHGVTCLRAGKTGEYGFVLLVPKLEASRLWQQLLAVGAPQGLVETDLVALDQCSLEDGHFSMRVLDSAHPSLALTPIELQLQWRVDYDKEFVGVEALRARRASPLGRVTCFIAPRATRSRDRVLLDDAEVGSVLAAGFSSVRGDWVGWALLDTPLAWPGLRFNVAAAEGAMPIETRSSPLLNNRSLHVDPRRHSHQTRANDQFPPLVVR
jgi:aminomethyltransferase